MMRKEKNTNSNQLEDKEQAYLRKVKQSNLQSKQRMPESGETDHVGKQASKQATPREETTKLIQAKLPRDDLPEEEWTKMNEEIEECKRLAWKILQEKSAGEAGDDKERC